MSADTSSSTARIAIIMGSVSDWPTMAFSTKILDQLDIAYHVEVISAHRTPDKLADFAKNSAASGFKVIIAGAGGAAHLPGMLAAHTRVPVLGVPVQSKALNGIDSLLSIVQMPRGVAVGTLAIGESGAYNAGLLASQILANDDCVIADRLENFRAEQTHAILAEPDPRL